MNEKNIALLFLIVIFLIFYFSKCRLAYAKLLYYYRLWLINFLPFFKLISYFQWLLQLDFFLLFC